MAHTYLVEAIERIHEVVGKQIFAYNAHSGHVIIKPKDIGWKTVNLIHNERFESIEFYMSQLLNSYDLKIERNYPELLPYIRLYFIEENLPIRDRIVYRPFTFHKTGVIHYKSRVASESQLVEVNIQHINDKEAYINVVDVHRAGWGVRKNAERFRVGVRMSMASEKAPLPEWTEYIHSAFDFYPNPGNIPIHDRLAIPAPKYCGNKLWVITDILKAVEIDGIWFPVFTDDMIPDDIMDEYRLYKSMEAVNGKDPYKVS